MPTPDLLANKVAIITGAGRGIGRAAALTFARAGAAVILAARSEEQIQQAATEIKDAGGRALAIQTDVTDLAAVDLLVTLCLRAFRRIDILVNNAGVLTPIGKTWEVHPREWQRLIQINVVGPYFCARAVLPHMLDRGEGRIINVSSGAANSDSSGWSAYNTSKAALNRFTSVLGTEVAATKIVVSAVNPGPTDTAMQADIREARAGAFPRQAVFRQWYEEGKLYRPEEPAQLLLWLASEFGQGQNKAILDIGDKRLRERIAKDLGLPVILNRREG